MFDESMKAAVDSLQEPADPTTFTSANGTVLKLKRVPNMIVMDAAKHIPVPKVPRVFDDDKQREIENPNDPDYLHALRMYGQATGQLAYDVYILLGTKVVSLGDGVSTLESNNWVDELQIVFPEIDIPEQGPRRRLAWMKYHVLIDDDIPTLMQRIQVLNGRVREEAVAEAAKSFRGETERYPVGRIHDPDETGRGDQPVPDGGDGSGSGDAGSGGVRTLPMDHVDGPII